MNKNMNVMWKLALVFALSSSFSLACSGTDQDKKPKGFDLSETTKDMSQDTSTEKDSTSDKDATSDMKKEDMEKVPDMKPDPPLRTVVSHKLFGQMPLNNQFKNPNFSNPDRLSSWVAVQANNPQQQLPLTLFRKRLLNAPDPDRAVLHLQAPSPNDRVQVYGELLNTIGVNELSVWVGISKDEVDDIEIEGTLTGLNSKAPASFAGIAVEHNKDKDMESDGIVWRQYYVMADQMVGYGYLAFTFTRATALYLNAPEMVPFVANGSSLRTGFVMGKVRNLRAEEIAGLKAVERIKLEYQKKVDAYKRQKQPPTMNQPF